jgi:hypothetical protein
MGKIYSAPQTTIKVPSMGDFQSKDGFDVRGYMKASDDHVKQVSEYAKKHGKGKFAGEEIQFPVADGAARYIVFSSSPVVLIHLAVGDAWQFQYANRITATDIKEQVERRGKLSKMFAARSGK